MSIVLRDYICHSSESLRSALLELLPEQGSYPSGIPGVSLHRFNENEPPRPVIYTPILVVVVQGRKWVKIGMDEFTYGDQSCFVAGIDMPVFCCVRDASPKNPHLALTMELDHDLLTQLAKLNHCKPCQGAPTLPGAQVQCVDDYFLDACLRLVKLLARPKQIPFLAPLYRAELHYRLLIGPFGRQLRPLYAAGSQENRMAQAVTWLRRGYKHHLHSTTLAKRVHMATSTFHKNFKNITTLSPLQYQKRLRLNEANRLLLFENCAVAEAAFAVGYEDQTQFSREYGKLFGSPPEKNIANALNGSRQSHALRV